jgi:hypothetical protein
MIHLLYLLHGEQIMIDIEELKKELAPRDMSDLDKLVQKGLLLESDAKLISDAFFNASSAFNEKFKTLQNYRAMTDSQRKAYMKGIEDLVWEIQNESAIQGHLYIAVGVAVFYKQLEQLESGSVTVFWPE